jgi:DNA-binding IclR family transcriptional regulator
MSIGERSPWAAAVAAPIFDRRGWPLATLSVSGPTQRLATGGLKELGGQVMQVAQQISTTLGYTPE